MERHFPARYEVIAARRAGACARALRPAGEPVRIAFIEDEERPALRLLLRALRQVDARARRGSSSCAPRSGPSSTPLRADLRDRVRYVDAATTPLEELLSGADVFVAASAGAEPRPALLARAAAAGVVPRRLAA